MALYLNLILSLSYGVAFGLCRFSYTLCFKVFLEVFFHFFGSGFTDNSNTVVVDLYILVSFSVFVFGFADYNLLDKFVYQFGCQLRKLRNRLCLFDKTLYKPTSPYLKEDLKKLDEISEQVRYMGKYHIETFDDLYADRAKIENDMNRLLENFFYIFYC